MDDFKQTEDLYVMIYKRIVIRCSMARKHHREKQPTVTGPKFTSYFDYFTTQLHFCISEDPPNE